MRWPTIGGALLALFALVLGPSTSGAARTVAPTNTSPPTVSGTAQQGETLTASSGSWTGTTPMVFSYQWRRCDTAGAACSGISGATGQTYQLTGADVGNTVRVRVDASNGSGSAEATSDETAVVTAANAPSNTSTPTISGTARQNETLTGNRGSWSGTEPISYAYQWRRCNSSGADCSEVSGASSQTYVLQSADVGKTLRLRITATNSAGSSQAVSDQTGVIAAAGTAPAVTTMPKIDGSPVVGESLNLDNGKWNGTMPISFAYQWQRCDSTGAACSSIAGATQSKHKLVLADAGKRLRGVVSASNSAGSSTAVSTPTAAVQGPPLPTVLPVISGTLRAGETLKATGGLWLTPKPLTAVFFQWTRCAADLKSCVVLQAFGPTYLLAAADVGRRLIVTVKAQNSIGSGLANSQPTGVVAARSTTVPPSKPSTPPAGTIPIPVASVSLPNRLSIDRVQFSPSRVRSRAEPLVGRFHVVDSNSRPVVGALVQALAVPFSRLSNEPESATGNDGWATVMFDVLPTFPLRKGYLITIFTRARKPGGSVLAGVSTRRLVSVRVG